MKRARPTDDQKQPASAKKTKKESTHNQWGARFQIVKVKEFLKLFDVLKTLLDVTTLNMSNEGITCMDHDEKDNVRVNPVVRPKFFSAYECRNPLTRITVPLYAVHNAVKYIYKKNKITTINVWVTEDKMRIQGSKDTLIGEFIVNSLETPEIIRIPYSEVKYDYDIGVESSELMNICSTLKSTGSDTVKFTLTNKYLCLSTPSDMTLSSKLRLKIDTDGCLNMPDGEETVELETVTTDLQYIVSVTSACTLDNHVRIYIKSGCPVVLRYTIMDEVLPEESSFLTVWIKNKPEELS